MVPLRRRFMPMLPIWLLKPEHTVAFIAQQRPVLPQRVQMRQALAERKGRLVQIERAPEQHGHDGGRVLRRAQAADLLQACPMMCVLLRDALVQAGERQPVRRQHQGVGRQDQQAVERVR